MDRSRRGLEILWLGGILWCLIHPAGAVLAAMKWLDREFVVAIDWFVISAVACYVAMPWGLEGVAWAVIVSQGYAAAHMTWLAHKCLSATRASLFAALAPDCC